jgi:hypothetical protein
VRRTPFGPAVGRTLVALGVEYDELGVESRLVPVDLDDVVVGGVVAAPAGRVGCHQPGDGLADGLGAGELGELLPGSAVVVEDLGNRDAQRRSPAPVPAPVTVPVPVPEASASEHGDGCPVHGAGD